MIADASWEGGPGERSSRRGGWEIETMFTLFVILHLLAAAVLILVVLLQSGKAGDLASAFGGAGTQTAFGTRSAATLLTKATAIAAVVFMATSLGLSILSSAPESTVMQDLPVASEQAAPPAAVPAVPESQSPPAESEPSPPPTEPPPSDQ